MSGVPPLPDRRSVLVSAAAASAASLFFAHLPAAGEGAGRAALETGKCIDEYCQGHRNSVLQLPCIR